MGARAGTEEEISRGMIDLRFQDGRGVRVRKEKRGYTVNANLQTRCNHHTPEIQPESYGRGWGETSRCLRGDEGREKSESKSGDETEILHF